MQKSSRLIGLGLSLFGIAILMNNLGKPRVEALHAPDIMGLVTSGFFIGVGAVGLIGFLAFPNEKSKEGVSQKPGERGE